MASQKVTFGEVRKEFIEQSGKPENDQVVRNGLTALNKFMECAGAAVDSDAYETLAAPGAKPKDVLYQYLAEEKGLESSSVKSSVSRLSKFILIARSMHEQRRLAAIQVSELQSALRLLIDEAGLSYKVVAAGAGVSASTLSSWVHGGRLPRPKSAESLAKLEEYFGLEPGVLQAHIVNPNAVTDFSREDHIETKGRGVMPHLSEFNKHVLPALKEQGVQDQHRLYVLGSTHGDSSVSRDFKDDWLAVVDFKTKPVVVGDSLIRKTTWKAGKPEVNERARRKNGAINSAGLVSSTAAANYGSVDRLVSFAVRPEAPSVSLSCVGLSEDRQRYWEQALAGAEHCSLSEFRLHMIADEGLLERFISHEAFLCEGAYSGLVSCLTGIKQVMTEDGYFFQGKRFASAAGVSLPEWQERVLSARKLLVSSISQLKEGQVSRYVRNPAENCKKILSHDHILSLLDAFEDRIDSVAPPASYGVPYAVWARDRLLVYFLNQNPLRTNTLSQITVGSPGAMLQKSDNGTWTLKIPKAFFKNLKGAKSDDYECRLPDRLAGPLEDYLEVMHLLRGGNESSYLFRPQSDDNENASVIEAWSPEAISKRWVTITGRYLPEYTDGYPAHTHRHVVATGLLQSSPEDYVTVAEILHDKPETVMASYAHMSPQHGQKRWSEIRSAAKARLRVVK